MHPHSLRSHSHASSAQDRQHATASILPASTHQAPVLLVLYTDVVLCYHGALLCGSAHEAAKRAQGKRKKTKSDAPRGVPQGHRQHLAPSSASASVSIPTPPVAVSAVLSFLSGSVSCFDYLRRGSSHAGPPRVRGSELRPPREGRKGRKATMMRAETMHRTRHSIHQPGSSTRSSASEESLLLPVGQSLLETAASVLPRSKCCCADVFLSDKHTHTLTHTQRERERERERETDS
jgi:hypothetical protein